MRKALLAVLLVLVSAACAHPAATAPFTSVPATHPGMGSATMTPRPLPSSTLQPSPILSPTPRPEPSPTPTPTPLPYSNTITRSDPLVLESDDVFEIVDTHFIMSGSILIKDNATLIIRNSHFEMAKGLIGGPGDFDLIAQDSAHIIVESSVISTNRPAWWSVWNNASVSITNMVKGGEDPTFPWMTFGGQSSATVRGSKFDATIFDEATFDIEDSPETYIELVFPVGAFVDEAFREDVDDFTFPNDNRGMDYRVSIRNSHARGWGITVMPQSNITIRDAHQVVTVIKAWEPWHGVAVELDDLRAGLYEDRTWVIEDTTLRFVNTEALQWAPIPFGDNTVIVRDSVLADISLDGPGGHMVIENSHAFFLRAYAGTELTARDSVIDADVIAQDGGLITLVNTEVHGEIVELNGGRVVVE